MATTPASNSMLRAALGVVANIAVLTSLLVYFGWQRSEVQAHELGISESLLDMSTQDYVLRSVRPVFVLVVCSALGGLAWVWVDRRLRRPGGPFGVSVTAASLSTQVRLVRGLAAVPLIVALFIIIMWPWLGAILLPAAIGIGLLIAFYATVLARIDSGTAKPARVRVDTRALCVAILVLACLFWTVGEYAKYDGRRLAEALQCDDTGADDAACFLFDLPRVLVYSRTRLSLAQDLRPTTGAAPGPAADVRMDIIPGTSEDDFQYRYSQLRLLERRMPGRERRPRPE